MTNKRTSVSAIDIGTTKMRAAIAHLDSERRVRVRGMGIVPSRGTWAGIIVNVDEARESISAAVKEAEKASSIRAKQACVGVGRYPGYPKPVCTAFTRHDVKVSPEDVKAALYSDSTYRDLAHCIHGFPVHGQIGITVSPVASVVNTAKCLRGIDIEPVYLVHRPLATSIALLEPGEKKAHPALIDIGGNVTDIATFKDSVLQQVWTFRAGGIHITTDIAIANTDISWEMAEKLKKRLGRIITPSASNDSTDQDSFQTDENGHSVSSNYLNKIITDRMKNMLEAIKAELSSDSEVSNVVLTGGTSNLPGIVTLAEQIFSLPVRVGTPSGVYDLPNAFMSPEYATVIGLLLWNAEHPGQNSTAKRPWQVFRTKLKRPLRFIRGAKRRQRG